MKANFQARFITYIFDCLLSLGMGFLLVYLFGFKMPFEQFLIYYVTKPVFYGMVFYFVYTVVCYLAFKGVSLGGLIFNDRVVKNSGKNMTFGVILIRALMQTLFPIAVFNIPYMLIYRTQISVFDAATDTKTVKMR